MAEFHFIKDEVTLELIQAILDLAGSNFNAPYTSDLQPTNAIAKNQEQLIQYQLPGGTSLQGYSETSITESMGSAINSMLAVLAPFMSAYGMILPILGIIKGIIEVLCALMNPIAVTKAIIRLFTKWIPPFISLFPPLAGVIIILSTIKAILAIVFYILTVLVPTVQLIVYNIKVLADSFDEDANEQKRQAGRDKLDALLQELANQLGVMSAFAPLLDIIFLIIQLVLGFPCSKKKKKNANATQPGIDPPKSDFNLLEEDSTCCNEDTCPDILKTPPSGRATLMPITFGDNPPFFAFKLSTNNAEVEKLIDFVQNIPDQLNGQLDEGVTIARPAGYTGDMSTLRVEITSSRGGSSKLDVPIAKIKDTDIIIISPSARKLIGVVNYTVKVNFDIVIMGGIIGLGCHPDVERAKDNAEGRYPDTGTSVAERFPRIPPIKDDYNNLLRDLNTCQGNFRRSVDSVKSKNPPYTEEIDAILHCQEVLVDKFTNFANNLKDILNNILANVEDLINSTLDTDKMVVRSDGKDKATLVVVPRDATGSAIAKNLPNGVDIAVDFLTDFGTISNKRRNNSTGQIFADLTSRSVGTANVTAKINGKLIATLSNNVRATRSIPIRFVSDAALPARRTVTKVTSTTTAGTGGLTDKEPGSK